MLSDNRQKHWQGVIEESHGEKGGVHSLRLDVYMKDKEEWMNRCFLVVVMYTKGVNIVCTCVGDNGIKEKDECKAT